MRSQAKGQTVLITGGAGFIGSHTAAALAEERWNVVAFDPLRIYAHPNTKIARANLSYRRQVLLRDVQLVSGSTLEDGGAAIQRAINEMRPRYVLHLGSLSLPPAAKADSEQAFESIARGTLNVLQAVASGDCVTKFVYVSSSMVYGDFTKIPMPESEPATPKDIYGGMKLIGEILTRSFTHATGIPHVIIRPSAVYGPTDLGNRIIQRLVECACLQRPLTLANPDTTALDFTYVTDLSAGLARTLAEPIENETLNLTAGEGRTLREAFELLHHGHPDMPVEIIEAEDFRPRRGTLAIDKARTLLGYEPRYRLEQGLEEYAAFIRTAVETSSNAGLTAVSRSSG